VDDESIENHVLFMVPAMRLTLIATILCLLFLSTPSLAGPPSVYWTITPATPQTPVLVPRPKQRYNYGWFGAGQHAPTKAIRRSYHRHYVEWMFK